jgi:hypothetical protein
MMGTSIGVYLYRLGICTELVGGQIPVQMLFVVVEHLERRQRKKILPGFKAGENELRTDCG